jgi:hypothetical protein
MTIRYIFQTFGIQNLSKGDDDTIDSWKFLALTYVSVFIPCKMAGVNFRTAFEMKDN